MAAVRGRCFEIFFATVSTHDRLADVVHSAQVKDEMLLELDELVAELAHELQPQTVTIIVS